MGRGDVEVKLDFKTGGANQAVTQTRAVYSAAESGMKKVGKQANWLDINMKKMGRSVLYGLGGFAGVAGISGTMGALVQGVTNFVAKRSELEKTITPLLSLGDNVNKISAIRKEVVQTGIAFGRTNEEVAGFLFDLQSTTGNLSSGTVQQLKRETLELSEVTGGDLVTAQNLLTKSFQIYGHEIENVNQLQNKLLLTQDKAALRFEDLATRAPEALQAGKLVGLSMDEVLGTIIGGTKRSGSIEKTMTGMRNFFLIMDEAQKKGVTLTGTYVDKLKQLGHMFITNRAKMSELFGKEVVVQASSFADAVNDISESITELGEVSAVADVALQKLQKRFEDTKYAASRKAEATTAVIDNAPELFGEGSTFGSRLHEKGRSGAVLYQNVTGGELGALGTGIGYAMGVINPRIAAAGDEITASNSQDGELFRNMMVTKAENKKAQRIEYLDSSIKMALYDNDIDPSAIEGMRSERDRIASTPINPALMSNADQVAGERSRYEGMAAKSINPKEAKYFQDLIAALDRNTAAKAQAKPGGGTANATE